MCGIYGWQLDTGSKCPGLEARFTLALGLARGNDARGGHSWGFAADGETERGLGCAIRAVGGADVGFMAIAETLVGHARFATVGARTVENAHPFRVGRVVGAHNGAVFNHRDLNREHGRKLPVDSQHLFAHLSEGRKLSEVHAYGAVEFWLDGHPHAVRIGRFNGGVLHAATIEGVGVVWSSTIAHLWDALEDAGLDRNARPFKIEENVLYAVKDGRISPKSDLDVGRQLPLPAPPPLRAATPKKRRGRKWFSQGDADVLEWLSREQHKAERRGRILFGDRETIKARRTE